VIEFVNKTPEQLMSRFKAGLQCEVFEEFTLSLLPSVLAVAKQILGNDTEAEDAVQETFLRVIRRREQYDEAKPFLPWLYTILRNVCRDIQRREGRRRSALNKLVQQTRSDPKDSQNDCNCDLLWELPPGEREVLYLRILHDLRFRDIAVALRISEAAAKKRAQRGLRRLRKKIRAYKGKLTTTRFEAVTA